MNKYERFFNQVLAETRDGKLKWQQLDKRSNADVIFNPNLVYRQYSSQLMKDGVEFTVLLVEKKFDDPDFEFPLESYIPELLALDHGELITSITDSVVSKSEMRKLANLVQAKNDKATKLFGTSKGGELLGQ